MVTHLWKAPSGSPKVQFGAKSVVGSLEAICQGHASPKVLSFCCIP